MIRVRKKVTRNGKRAPHREDCPRRFWLPEHFRYTAMMRGLLSNRPLRLLFAANFVSMFGSGMNTSAVNWYILQATHSEQLLGILVVAQALPSLVLMPFAATCGWLSAKTARMTPEASGLEVT